MKEILLQILKVSCLYAEEKEI